MPRPLCSAVLLLALSWPVFSTPEIPSAFFEAQQQQQQHRQPGADPSALRQVHYEESFRAWMAEHGMIFRTREDFGDRLRIFADNRCVTDGRRGVGALLSALCPAVLVQVSYCKQTPVSQIRLYCCVLLYHSDTLYCTAVLLLRLKLTRTGIFLTYCK